MAEKVKIFKDGEDWVALADGWKIICNSWSFALSQGTFHLRYPKLRMPNSTNYLDIIQKRGI